MRCTVNVIVHQYSIIGGGKEINLIKNWQNGQENFKKGHVKKSLPKLAFFKNMLYIPPLNTPTKILAFLKKCSTYPSPIKYVQYIQGLL